MEKMITIAAAQRSVTGKKVRSLRREGWIPGVLYGPGEAVSVQFARKELAEAYRQVGTSALIGVLLEGQKKARPAIIREVQRNTLSLEILHVDFELVDMKRQLTTHVPVALHGESPVVQQGLSVLTHGVNEIEIRCLPADVPARLDVDLALLTQPDQFIHVSDLIAPPGVAILTEPGTVIVYTTSIRRLEEAEARAEAKAAEVVAAVETAATEEKAAAEKAEE